MPVSRKGLHSYVIDITPSKYYYEDKGLAVKDAKKDWANYSTKVMPHLSGISYDEAIAQGMVWFDNRKVKS